MANRCIIFRTDNAALVDIINHQTSKHKLVMTLVCDLVLTSLQHNIIFQAKHIEGIHNTFRSVMGSLHASLCFSGLCGRLGGVATLISVAVDNF